jgi:hypothetical protein
VPKATGVAFDRGTPFEMSDPLNSSAADTSAGHHSAFIKRDNPRFPKNPGPIVGAIITALCVFLVLFLSMKYCIRLSYKSTDLEKGKRSCRRYPYSEDVVRGRKRYRNGSPPVTRPDDIPISEGYGMDPVDLARAQNWQEGFDEKGVYVTRSRATGADSFQSSCTHENDKASEYAPQLPSFLPTRNLVPKPRPITQLPLLYDAQYTDGRPVSPASANNSLPDNNRTRDYSNVSPSHPPTMHREHSGQF